MKSHVANRTKPSKWYRTPSFGVSVLLAVAIVGVLIVLVTHEHGMTGVKAAYAVLTHTTLRLLGQPTTVTGSVVQSGRFGITVVTACTGLFVTTLFVVAVLLFPASWVAKSIGAAVGVIGIAVVNVVRLVSLYFVGVYWPQFFDLAHQLVWQSLLIVIAVSLWLVWAGRTTGRKRVAP